MRYLYLVLIFFIASFLYLFFNYYDNGWQFFQPFLIAVLLVYFNYREEWLHYMFAMMAGFFVDAFTGVFALHAFLFVLIIFILKSFQVTIFSSKNILAIILLTLFSFILFWLLFWLSDIAFTWELYTFDNILTSSILKMMSVNIFLVIAIHLIYYNFWAKSHEQKQSF